MSVFWLGSCRSTVMTELMWRRCWCEFRGGSSALAVALWYCSSFWFLCLYYVAFPCSTYVTCDKYLCSALISFAGVLCKQGHLFCCLLLLFSVGGALESLKLLLVVLEVWEAYQIFQWSKKLGDRIENSLENSVSTWCRARFLEYRFHLTIVWVVIY